MAGEHLGPDQVEIAEKYDEVIQVYNDQALNGRDDYIKLLATEVRDELERKSKLYTALTETLAIRPGLSVVEAANLLRVAIQAYQLRQGPDGRPRYPFYPIGLDEPGAWSAAIKGVVSNEYYPTLAEDLQTRHLSSTRYQRGVVIPMLAMLHGLTGKYHLMEVGTGLAHIPNKLAELGKGGLRFDRTEVVDFVPSESGVTIAENSDQTETFNYLLKQPIVKLGGAIAVDIIDREEKDAVLWAEASSLDPHDHLSQKRVMEFRRLTAARPANVHFYRDKFGESFNRKGFEKMFKKLALLKKLDIIAFPTVLHQAETKHERQAMIELAEYYLRKAAKATHDDSRPKLLLISEFATIKPKGSMRIHKKHWYNWTYATYAKNLAQPSGAAFKRYFTAETGSVKRIRLEPAVGELPVAQQLGLVPRFKR